MCELYMANFLVLYVLLGNWKYVNKKISNDAVCRKRSFKVRPFYSKAMTFTSATCPAFATQ